MKTYSSEKIIRILGTELIYIDESNSEKTIDLKECTKNWMNHVNQSGDFTDSEGRPVIIKDQNETRCVGVRDWFENNPYFEFFSEPKIRFEVRIKNQFLLKLFKGYRQKFYGKFRNIQKLLEQAGWTTFDNG